MLHKKITTTVVVATAALLVSANPAAALSSVDSGSSCTSRTLVQSLEFDNPYKSGYQKYGNLKLYTGWCNSGSWRGAWGEANKVAGGALKVGVSVYHADGSCCSYALSKTGQSTATPGPAGTVTYTYVVGQALSTAGYDRASASATDPNTGRVLGVAWAATS